MKTLQKYPRLAGWIVFFAGFGLLIASDYALRMRDGDMKDGGMPEMVWFAAQWALAATAAWLVWRGARKVRRRVIAVAETSLHLAAGFALYLWLGLPYILTTGIDSL